MYSSAMIRHVPAWLKRNIELARAADLQQMETNEGSKKKELLQRDATRDETRSFKDASSTPFRQKKYIYMFFFLFCMFLKNIERQEV